MSWVFRQRIGTINVRFAPPLGWRVSGHRRSRPRTPVCRPRGRGASGRRRWDEREKIHTRACRDAALGARSMRLLSCSATELTCLSTSMSPESSPGAAWISRPPSTRRRRRSRRSRPGRDIAARQARSVRGQLACPKRCPTAGDARGKTSIARSGTSPRGPATAKPNFAVAPTMRCFLMGGVRGSGARSPHRVRGRLRALEARAELLREEAHMRLHQH
jgi:hypothetical protein